MSENKQIDGDWEMITSQTARLECGFGVLKIAGDSMINVDIADGDMVLVKKQREFVSGDIVLAQINGDWSVKRFISDDKPPFVYLKPENEKYENIIFFGDIRMRGKVISILKNNLWKEI